MNEKITLLNLSYKEKRRLKRACHDLIFYLGECEYKNEAFLNPELLGQNWITADNLDYIPSQVIDNKVKPLINKQARFMLSKRPDILFKPFDVTNNAIKENVESLRQFIDKVLEYNMFWHEAMKAFKLATITKKVLLRIEANPNEPIHIFWHGVNDFNYKVDPNDPTLLVNVVIVVKNSETAGLSDEKQKWNRYTYDLRYINNETQCWLTCEIFLAGNLGMPIESTEINTGLSRIPCWVIHNEKDMANPHGQSDLKDLIPLQEQYNRRLSDFSDALRFNMFGQDVFIDATPDSVNKSIIAPNAIIPLVSLDDRKADYKKVENTFSNVAPVQFFLNLLNDSMYEKLAIPKPEEIKNVVSGKALKYLYTELIARCEEKWIDWEPPIRQLINFIIEACAKFNCYPNEWDSAWESLDFRIIIKKNYPIAEDEEDAKRLAMEEVAANVRSNESYIKDFGNDEDYHEEFNLVCENLARITSATSDQFDVNGSLGED